MNGKHASGRLTVEPPVLPGLGSLLVGSTPAIIARVADEDDARRLAAAWNACDGMPTERIEEMVGFGGVPAVVVYGDDVRRERDGWREEAEGLQRRLKFAESDLDAMRKHQDRDAWYWQGDGMDHVESMGRDMVVVIHAGDLQALLAACVAGQPLPPDHARALADLAKRYDMSEHAVMRAALRLYQAQALGGVKIVHLDRGMKAAQADPNAPADLDTLAAALMNGLPLNTAQRSQLWLLVDAKRQAQPTEAEQLLPHAYLLAKLARVIPLFQEARDALTAITELQRKARGISPTLADRMDAAGTFSVDDWKAQQ